MQSCPLDTVYRSKDEEHLLFCNRIRVKQPTSELQEEYFGDRHWKDVELTDAVATGMQLAEAAGEPFAWLSCTNRGASEVCRAAIALAGITEEELKEFHDARMATQKEVITQYLADGKITQEQHDNWMTRFDDMENFHEENGFVSGFGHAGQGGYGGCARTTIPQ